MARKNAAREGAGLRKIAKMLEDLKKLKRELIPDDDEKKRSEEMKTLDDYGRKKYEIQDYIKEIREDIERLHETKKNDGGDGTRNVHTIRLQTDNNKKLKQAMELFNELKAIHLKDEKKNPKRKGKKKIDEKEMNDRRKYLLLVAEEIKHLMAENSNARVVLDNEELAMQNRVERRREEARQKRNNRKRERSRSRSRRRSGVGGGDDDDDDDDFKPVRHDAQLLAFEEKVQENIREQDEMLKEISEGLDELKNLALEANKHLTVQKTLLDQVEDKMDNTIRDFKTANKRLQELLDESGGMSRWCPIMICLVVFVALIGYMFKMF